MLKKLIILVLLTVAAMLVMSLTQSAGMDVAPDLLTGGPLRHANPAAELDAVVAEPVAWPRHGKSFGAGHPAPGRRFEDGPISG